jgi:centromeric protein E
MQPDRTFLLRCSYLEIYNEQLNDLLLVGNKNLSLRESVKQSKFVVSELTEEVVTSPAACMELIDRGNRNRCVGVSNLNEHSSRSHSIFRMVLESQDGGDSGGVRVSELNLVDLAGSETLTYEFGTLPFLIFCSHAY